MSYRVYAIQLKKSVLESGRFRNANPDYQAKKPCMYVGSTGKTIDERLADHLSGGENANRYVFKYFKKLRPDVYQGIRSRRSRRSAEKREARLAEYLRGKGWAVWQK